MYRDYNINKVLYQEGDFVKSFRGEEGIIVEILDHPWGFTHIVKLTKGNALYKVGEIVEYKPEQSI